MAEGSLKRKLVAILSADVKGYSRLMGEDEEWTVRTLNAYREAMGWLVQRYRGRVVDAVGDNVLAEFGSVVDAVNCAVEIQRELAEKNLQSPAGRKMEFRIGVNLGDVIEEGERIYGDGVNIAARLEGLAEPGGICISGTAYDQVENKLGLEYGYLGEQTVKNIAKPVRVYRVLSVLEAATDQVVRADLHKMAFPLPDKPSIAVLPFANMSKDPDQEYFCAGMTEDLITDLSKISGLFVIARNSTFTYKGKAVKIAQVAEELGVRYVMEGSVRKAGGKLRINAQLIDATTGGHLWSERYDGSQDDVFALQDQINQKIVAALAVKSTEGEGVRVARKGTNSPAAYDEYLKGRAHASRNTREDFAKGEACYKKAIELDPNYAQARPTLASLYHQRWGLGLGEKLLGSLKDLLLARRYLRAAMRQPTPMAYALAGHMDVFRRQHDTAILHLEKALSLDPDDPDILLRMGHALTMDGCPTEAMEHLKRAMRFDPINPDRALFQIGLARYCMGEWEEAVTVFEKAMKASPGYFQAISNEASPQTAEHVGEGEGPPSSRQA